MLTVFTIGADEYSFIKDVAGDFNSFFNLQYIQGLSFSIIINYSIFSILRTDLSC